MRLRRRENLQVEEDQSPMRTREEEEGKRERVTRNPPEPSREIVEKTRSASTSVLFIQSPVTGGICLRALFIRPHAGPVTTHRVHTARSHGERR